MALSEFSVIDRFFRPLGRVRSDVQLGIGDDAALTRLPSGHELVTTVDTLVAGVHFPVGATANDIAHKALAVNLSDLAAMGAQPAWATLALTLPEINESWLQDFAAGWVALADQFDVALIGGDTTRGPLTITVSALGSVPEGGALRRDAARPLDHIYVSGYLGDGYGGLRCVIENKFHDPNGQYLRDRLNRPSPRVSLGRKLRGVAHSAIDISDGLLADLNHILVQSQCGALIDPSALPLSSALLTTARDFLEHPCVDGADFSAAQRCALAGGDDYELCFTVAPDLAPRIEEVARSIGCSIARIGTVESASGVRIVSADGSPREIAVSGFQHF